MVMRRLCRVNVARSAEIARQGIRAHDELRRMTGCLRRTAGSRPRLCPGDRGSTDAPALVAVHLTEDEVVTCGSVFHSSASPTMAAPSGANTASVSVAGCMVGCCQWLRIAGGVHGQPVSDIVGVERSAAASASSV